MTFIDILDGGPGPKRGDLLYTALKDRRGMRLRIVLHAYRVRRKDPKAPPRYMLWAERWWEITPEMRQKLYRSAERAGGQRAFYMNWYPRVSKKKQSFEQYMKRSDHGR